MQRCKFCKTEIPEHAHFCPNCGEYVSAKESEKSNNFPMTLRQLGFARPVAPDYPTKNKSAFPDKKPQSNLLTNETALPGPKWLLFFVATLILVAGSIGTLTAILHISLPLTDNLPHTTSITQATPTKEKSRAPIISSDSTPCPDAISDTGSALNGQIQLTLSGALSGKMKISRFLFSCGLAQNTQKLQYTLTGCGSIGNQEYSYIIDVVPYSGPGTYTRLSDIGITALTTAGDTCGSVFIRHDWNEQSSTITIMKDEKSGTFRCLLQATISPTPTPSTATDTTPMPDSANNTVQMTGNWTLR